MQFSAVYCHSYRFIMSLHYSRHTLLHPRPSSRVARSSSATIHSWQPNQPSIDRVPCAFRQQQPKWIIIWVWSESMEGSFCDCKRIVLAINYYPVTHYKTHWIDRVQPPPSPSLRLSDSPCQLGNQTNRNSMTLAKESAEGHSIERRSQPEFLHRSCLARRTPCCLWPIVRGGHGTILCHWSSEASSSSSYGRWPSSASNNRPIVANV